MKERSTYTMPFAKERFENLILLPVCLNGVETIAMFDTGAGLSFVTESLAKKVDLQKEDSAGVAGNNNGATLAFEKGKGKQFTIADKQVTDLTVGILPDEAFDFGEDSNHQVFSGEMLLGWDIISQFCWDFDMKQRTVTIHDGGYAEQTDTLQWNRFPIIQTIYEGKILPMGFDSGHTETMLDYTWKERLQELNASESFLQGVGSGNTENVYVANQVEFQIDQAKVTLNNVEVYNRSISGAEEGSIVGLFGADILQHAKWRLDSISKCFCISID
ncbi:retropepsin-like aspartic protease [Anaerosporobacter faecicola]|uniref:retropepsin-like aspartic protease n=1 Tax=Anaerosporobacter faecicola TaxID=2718714 RepID=UPI00143C30E5|nr:retropepsin-like aspartic protease [Anaerosporobacter faecicola]